MDDKEQKAAFTVFVDSNDGWSGHCTRATLQEAIDYAAEPGIECTYTPIAWVQGAGAWRERDESIAAGRVIKQVDGKWVAFGPGAVEFTATLDRPAPTPKVKAALDLLEQGFKAQGKSEQKTPERLFVIGKTYKTKGGLAGVITEYDSGYMWVTLSDGAERLYEMNGHYEADRLTMFDLIHEEAPAFCAFTEAAQSEPKRPCLTWADSKPFDAFPGFQSRTTNSSWAAPDSGKFADRRRDSPQVNPGHALAAVRQLVR